jgi:hypothetical protein
MRVFYKMERIVNDRRVSLNFISLFLNTITIIVAFIPCDAQVFVASVTITFFIDDPDAVVNTDNGMWLSACDKQLTFPTSDFDLQKHLTKVYCSADVHITPHRNVTFSRRFRCILSVFCISHDKKFTVAAKNLHCKIAVNRFYN